ncbi:uncharacterized protein LOC142765148 [Rhipicephalus microplus]|uniref:uncharacterized protein LOC142765148 n=1 Tax=Rhipicephalus microplus TaxID=6941 RepID=UPI003F6D9B38
MDASTFYGGTRVQDHASRRQKVDDETAEDVLNKIANGDVSDGDFSDDEKEEENEENIPANGQVSASMSSSAQPSTSQTPVTNLKEPAASKKFEIKWTKKEFAPRDVECDYNPETASAPEQPLVYFSKYFTDDLFQDFAEFTNRYVLQRDGTVLATTKEEIKVFFGILMLMGVLKYPRVRMYWQAATRISGCDGWLEYIRDANAEGLLKKDTMDMMAFQRDGASCLLSVNKPQKKRARPSSENPQVMKRKAPNASPLPPCHSYVRDKGPGIDGLVMEETKRQQWQPEPSTINMEPRATTDDATAAASDDASQVPMHLVNESSQGAYPL